MKCIFEQFLSATTMPSVALVSAPRTMPSCRKGELFPEPRGQLGAGAGHTGGDSAARSLRRGPGPARPPHLEDDAGDGGAGLARRGHPQPLLGELGLQQRVPATQAASEAGRNGPPAAPRPGPAQPRSPTALSRSRRLTERSCRS